MFKMKKYIMTLFSLIIIFSSLFKTVSFAQFTEEQEAKINAAVRKAEEKARNLPAHEKKIAWFILTRINRMIKEDAKNNPNVIKEYSSKGFCVDENGRVQVNVALLRSAKSSSEVVANKISKLGGRVRLISNPLGNYPVEMYCWIPYEAIKEVAKLKQVGNISSVGFRAMKSIRRPEQK